MKSMAAFDEILEKSLDKGKGCTLGVSDTCLLPDQSSMLTGFPEG